MDNQMYIEPLEYNVQREKNVNFKWQFGWNENLWERQLIENLHVLQEGKVIKGIWLDVWYFVLEQIATKTILDIILQIIHLRHEPLIRLYIMHMPMTCW